MVKIEALQNGIENVQEYKRQKTEFAQSLRYLCDSQRHLICEPYTFANLHIMAEDLGLGKHWFHKDHYDIPVKRIDDITSKCEVVSPKEIVRIIKEANKGEFREKRKG